MSDLSSARRDDVRLNFWSSAHELDAVAKLADQLARGDAPSTATVIHGRDRLIQQVSRKYQLSRRDAEDAVAEAFAIFLRKSRELHLEGTSAASYLTKTAYSCASDALRSLSKVREVLTEEISESSLATRDDSFDRIWSTQQVVNALKSCRDEDDDLAFQVATTMMDSFFNHGVVPTSREVADALGVSHTGVRKALLRFRAHIVSEGVADD